MGRDYLSLAGRTTSLVGRSLHLEPGLQFSSAVGKFGSACRRFFRASWCLVAAVDRFQATSVSSSTSNQWRRSNSKGVPPLVESLLMSGGFDRLLAFEPCPTFNFSRIIQLAYIACFTRFRPWQFIEWGHLYPTDRWIRCPSGQSDWRCGPCPHPIAVDRTRAKRRFLLAQA